MEYPNTEILCKSEKWNEVWLSSMCVNLMLRNRKYTEIYTFIWVQEEEKLLNRLIRVVHIGNKIVKENRNLLTENSI